MQPQDPSAPQQPNASTPMPGSSPSPTPPAPAPIPGETLPGQGQPVSTPPTPAPSTGPKKKKTMMIVVGAIVGLAILAGLGFGAMKMFGSGIKLENFSNDEFSLLVPVGYEKSEDNFVEFKEKTSEDTQSEVMAYYEKFPQALEESDLKDVQDLFKEQLESAATEELVGDDEKVEDLKVEDIQFKGKDAIQLTAKVVDKNSNEEGTVKLVAVITKNEIYMVGVGAHTSDPGLVKKIDTIINSFELK